MSKEELRRQMDDQLIEGIKDISSIKADVSCLKTDMQSIKNNLEGLKLFKAKVIGASVASSGIISMLVNFWRNGK